MERTALETPRVRLCPATLEDLEALHQQWVDPDVRRYLWDDRTISLEEARTTLEACMACFPKYGFGLWVIGPRRPPRSLLGFAALRPVDEGPEIELLYGIAPHCWGRGLATEAGRAVLDYGFEVCGFERILGRADSPNRASVRVLEKLGMSYQRELLLNGNPTVVYVADRAHRQRSKEG